MTKKPTVHEIFNPTAAGHHHKPTSPGRNPPQMPGRNAAFEFDKKETIQQTQLTTKKNMAPNPPMKKFGGYKPKILSGEDSFIPVSSDKKQAPDPPDPPRRPAPVLTKPAPFVIGDKNVPMVLSTLENGSESPTPDDLKYNMEEMHIYEEPQITSNVEINNNDFNNNNSEVLLSNNPLISDKTYNNNKDEIDHHHAQQKTQTNNEAFTVVNEGESLIDTNHEQKDPSTFATDNPVFNNIDEPAQEEPEGIFIPAPDYDEDEQSMIFSEEDPDDLTDEQQRERQEKEKQQQQRQQHVQKQQPGLRMKVYEGEDFSKYLSDDDDVEIFRENVNTKAAPVRLQQKHSLFKTKPQHHAHTTGKRKNMGKNKSQAFNSVRNFSFADSKYATNGKAGGKKLGNTPDDVSGDYESFLSTSQHGEGYETYLRSKHGVGLDNPRDGYNPSMANGGEGKGFKKLTVRLRNKLQRNGYDMKH